LDRSGQRKNSLRSICLEAQGNFNPEELYDLSSDPAKAATLRRIAPTRLGLRVLASVWLRGACLAAADLNFEIIRRISTSVTSGLVD
jgi:hypothetical protein